MNFVFVCQSLPGNAKSCKKGDPYLTQFSEVIKSVAAGLRFILVRIIDHQHWLLCALELQNDEVFHFNSLKIKKDHRDALSKCLTAVKGMLKPIFPKKKLGKPIEPKDFPQQEG